MAGQLTPAPLPSQTVLLAGPTAVGKSEAALLLAEKLGGEIISVDSMQVYRGLDIGTGKPSASDRARVPHHLIDVASLSESFDAARFVSLATEALHDIAGRGKIPILCGGTGLYFQGLQGGLGQAPPSNATLRAELEAMPLENLLQELAERDPVTNERIDRANARRVVRAIEVMRLTGKPFSALQSNWSQGTFSERSFLLSRSATDLEHRIDTRVDKMFADGLVLETTALIQQGLRENRTAMQALGYRQVIAHLDGERTLEQTIELVKIRTRQFARRQRTWFQKRGSWTVIRLAEENGSPATAAQIESKLRKANGLIP
jgi:tRNA dimethylallyltransferase